MLTYLAAGDDLEPFLLSAICSRTEVSIFHRGSFLKNMGIDAGHELLEAISHTKVVNYVDIDAAQSQRKNKEESLRDWIGYMRHQIDKIGLVTDSNFKVDLNESMFTLDVCNRGKLTYWYAADAFNLPPLIKQIVQDSNIVWTTGIPLMWQVESGRNVWAQRLLSHYSKAKFVVVTHGAMIYSDEIQSVVRPAKIVEMPGNGSGKQSTPFNPFSMDPLDTEIFERVIALDKGC